MDLDKDSTRPEFWETRIRSGRMPWDKGGAQVDLLDYLAETPSSGERVLIPGCGTAYEVEAFSAAGYEVVGIDFCEAAVEMARNTLGSLGETIVLGDFLTFDFGAPPFDVIYERAFLCSLPPDLWPRYARRISELLQEGGWLVGYFYYGPRDDDGPPFGLLPDELGSLFDGAFACVVDREARDSVSVFVGNERFQVWERICQNQCGRC